MNRRDFIKSLFAAGTLCILPQIKLPIEEGLSWDQSGADILADIRAAKKAIMESSGKYKPFYYYLPYGDGIIKVSGLSELKEIMDRDKRYRRI